MMGPHRKPTSEPAIEPEIPICDPHFHFFNTPELKYMMDDLLEDIKGGHNVIRNVYIDCHTGYRTTGPAEMRPVGETEYVVNLTERYEGIIPGAVKVAAGIVGTADLNAGEAAGPVLEAHIAAGKGRFRGVRQEITPRGDPGQPLTPEMEAGRRCVAADTKFREGFACLQKLGLSFDTILYLPHLPYLRELAEAFPKTTIIINHAGIEPTGNPERQQELMQNWKPAIVELAACKNIYIKLGGFGMGTGNNWRERPSAGSAELAEAAAPYVLWCIEQLGSRRCMFESNYPVESMDFSFNVIWNAFKLMTKDMPKNERQYLFYNTAMQAYRLQ